MRLEVRCHSDIDLRQPGVQVEIRSHIARCLRNCPHGDEGVITLAAVEHASMSSSPLQLSPSPLHSCRKLGRPICAAMG
jgi:hypothetical protein